LEERGEREEVVAESKQEKGNKKSSVGFINSIYTFRLHRPDHVRHIEAASSTGNPPNSPPARTPQTSISNLSNYLQPGITEDWFKGVESEVEGSRYAEVLWSTIHGMERVERGDSGIGIERYS